MNMLDTGTIENEVEALAAVIDHDDATDHERTAFSSMMTQIVDGKRSQLTTKQREWLRDVAQRLGISTAGNLWSSASDEERERRATNVR